MIDFIDIHTHRLEKDENTFSILNISLPCNEIPEKIYISTGWHPWFIDLFDLHQIKNSLEKVAWRRNVLALGECGFDRSIKIPVEKQSDVFRVHLTVAKMVGKPLIIHCVRAYSDLLETLKKEKFNGKICVAQFQWKSISNR